MKYNWALNESNFTWLDRIKICGFFLNPNNRWTQDKYVREYEQKMAKYIGCHFAIFVSSGSTANTILAMWLKDTIYKSNNNKNIVVFPSTTWITSVSPFIREGFIPKFLDVSLSDFSIDLDRLENYLKENKDKVAAVFVTSLLGFSPNIYKLKQLELIYDVKIMLDNCEATLTSYNKKNISSYFTSTTSTYFGHNITSGTAEGGFIFTNNLEEYEYFLMARNHGMTRSLPCPNHYQNSKVDHRFDFAFLGNNFRNTEIAAFGGLLEINRIPLYIKKRQELYNLFYNSLKQKNKYILPNRYYIDRYDDVAFCLPIIVNHTDLTRINNIKNICESSSVESRPVIGGFLGHQSAFKKYFKDEKESDFPNSVHLNYFGFYVGLHSKLEKEQIISLTNILNKL